jgi:hypothetical protein
MAWHHKGFYHHISWENVCAHHSCRDVLGLSVIEQWTHSALQADQQKATIHSTLLVQDVLINAMEPAIDALGAHLEVKDDLDLHAFDQVLLPEFFGERDCVAGEADANAGNTRVNNNCGVTGETGGSTEGTHCDRQRSGRVRVAVDDKTKTLHVFNLRVECCEPKELLFLVEDSDWNPHLLRTMTRMTGLLCLAASLHTPVTHVLCA